MLHTEEISVILTPDQAQYIEKKVKSGDYESTSDVVQDGLNSLLEQDKRVDAWLRDTVAATYDRIKAGEGRFHTIDEARQILADRIASQRER